MSTTSTILIDSVDIATLLLDISDHTGEAASDGLTRLLPHLDEAKREAILNDAQILTEQKENAALPDDSAGNPV